MKNLRKPYISMVMAVVVLFASCEQYDTPEVESINKFDYSMYENSSDFFLDIQPFNNKGQNSKTNNYQAVLDYANSPFDTPVMTDNEVLNYINLDTSEILKIGLEKGYLSETDIKLIKQLDKDMQSSGFNFAINKYQKSVLSLNISSSKFVKYNRFVNILMMTKSNYSRYVQNNTLQAKSGWACGLAILSFTASTVFVGSTCVPNPVTIYACPIAVARASLAYASMLLACTE